MARACWVDVRREVVDFRVWERWLIVVEGSGLLEGGGLFEAVVADLVFWA